MFLDVLLDALLDCLKLLPFLGLTVFFMEYLEHRAGERLVTTLRRAGKLGPAVGAALGCIPQCGFSASAAQLFNGGLISAGTLLAVFLSTSDEAVPILIANPGGWRTVVLLLLVKVVIAVVFGMLLDLLWNRALTREARLEPVPKHDCDSDGSMKSIVWEAVKRTLSIFLFMFLVTVALGLVISLLGEETLAKVLLPGPFQPLLAAVIGLIPNCAASVLLTRLYIDGMITFGSAVAGLCASAGIGLLVLLRGKRGLRTCLVLIAALLVASVVSGSVIQLLG